MVSTAVEQKNKGKLRLLNRLNEHNTPGIAKTQHKGQNSFSWHQTVTGIRNQTKGQATLVYKLNGCYVELLVG